ncbi:hypothetical protein BGX34_003365, partial [Mortierella sp. NVP85]
MPPTSQRLKSPGHVSPMNHTHDTQHELQRYIEEMSRSEEGQAQPMRPGRQNTKMPSTFESSSRTPCGASFLNNQLKQTKTSSTVQKTAHTASNGSGGKGTRKTGNSAKARGERKKLDDELVLKIKRCHEENPEMSCNEIARKYGV